MGPTIIPETHKTHKSLTINTNPIGHPRHHPALLKKTFHSGARTLAPPAWPRDPFPLQTRPQPAS
jgi:hypothetical protein